MPTSSLFKKLWRRSLICAAIATSVIGLISCKPDTTDAQQSAKIKEVDMSKMPTPYPETRKGDVIDTYFGTQVPDPYRWLEDDLSDETAAWVDAQNAVTQQVLSHITFRDKIAATLKSMYDYERITAPFVEGDYTYFYKNDGLQNHSVLFRQKDGGEPEVFLDPNTFSEDGTVSLTTVAFSEDASMVAYMTSTGGSDWREAYIIDTETKEAIGVPLKDIKFSGLSWYKNEGFYYSSYDMPDGSELSAKTDQHKVYFHRIGTPQSEDTKVFGHVESEKYRYAGAGVSEDGRYLIAYGANTTSGNHYYVKDLSSENPQWQVIYDQDGADVDWVTSKGDDIYLTTNLDAPNKRLVKTSITNPTPENWVDVIAETENVLSISTVGGQLFANYMIDAKSKVFQYDLEGQLIREITLPGVGTASVNSGKVDATKTYFTFANAITPTTIYALDLATGEPTVFAQPKTAFDASKYVSEQVFYTSKDGTRVPMLITHRQDLDKDGTAPTILYGYGGFNISLTPRFSPIVAAWLELGGVYAVPNIRGGGEYGKAWHKAGTQMQKQNVFDDFIAAGEYLIENGYTSSEKMALSGSSNGGLLVGAVMTQRPTLAAVAFPDVGVLDMLRYHTFTAGAGWAYDYGTAEQSKAMFEYLLGYSPVHNVKEGVRYPATMVTTADHDDRVVPAHSYKFIAELQDHHQGDNPVVIRIEKDAGHGAGTPISKRIEESADMFGFALYHMGIKSL
ncbi:MAG: prolyl oligopeptidase family serine peptidase [Alteromonadaceae bacterium]|nr:prolyl oligopeptidase family serine peptidase [Alteromonadaceae bacterium]